MSLYKNIVEYIKLKLEYRAFSVLFMCNFSGNYTRNPYPQQSLISVPQITHTSGILRDRKITERSVPPTNFRIFIVSYHQKRFVTYIYNIGRS